MAPGHPLLIFQEFPDAVEITIPKLNERVYEQVEVASVPFVSFIANNNQNGETANYSFVQRGYVRHWLGQVWEEYDRIKLKDIIANGGTNTAVRARKPSSWRTRPASRSRSYGVHSSPTTPPSHAASLTEQFQTCYGNVR